MVLRLRDQEGCSVSFPSSWRDDQAALQVRGRMQTDPVATADIGCQSAAKESCHTQTSDREVDSGGGGSSSGSGGGEAKAAEDAPEPLAEYVTGDDPDLDHFLAAAAPLLLHELVRAEQSAALALGSYEEQTAASSGEWTLSLSLDRPCGDVEEQDDLYATSLAWNATGRQLLVGFGRFDSFGWCSHRGSVCLWNVFARGRSMGPLEKNSPPDVRLETPSGVMSVAAHPSTPSVLAAGTFSGEVHVFDLTRLDVGDDVLVAATPIDDFCHREPVLQVEWVPDARRPGSFLLASVSSDGRVLMWDPASTLEAPLAGFALASEGRRKPLGATSVSFFSGGFVAGAEGGALCRCATTGLGARGKTPERWSDAAAAVLAGVPAREQAALKLAVEKLADAAVVQPRHLYEAGRAAGAFSPFRDAVRFRFKPHVGPVHAVRCAPFHRNALLTCGADGELRVYSLLDKDPAVSLRPARGGRYLHCCAWSPHRPAVLAASSSAGELFVFDLAQDAAKPALVLAAGGEEAAPVFAFDFNRRTRGIVAAGDGKGRVNVFKLGWRLSNRQPVDKAALDKVVHLAGRS